ncbi:MAG TPA: phosphoribosyltransferase family protein [Chitinophagaceae bacterium]
MFKNRSEAGKLLAAKLIQYKHTPGVILAGPRGGVPVAYEIARALNLPMEVVLVKKLGHPFNKEYAIGAVGLSERYLVPHEEVSDVYINSETEKLRVRLREMQRDFLGGKEPQDITGKTVIVVDDGIATGNTIIATIRILRRSDPAKIIIAAPVVSESAALKITAEADDLVVLSIPDYFYGVGAFYDDFRQVSDEEVLHYLKKLNTSQESVENHF